MAQRRRGCHQSAGPAARLVLNFVSAPCSPSASGALCFAALTDRESCQHTTADARETKPRMVGTAPRRVVFGPVSTVPQVPRDTDANARPAPDAAGRRPIMTWRDLTQHVSESGAIRVGVLLVFRWRSTSKVGRPICPKGRGVTWVRLGGGVRTGWVVRVRCRAWRGDAGRCGPGRAGALDHVRERRQRRGRVYPAPRRRARLVLTAGPARKRRTAFGLCQTPLHCATLPLPAHPSKPPVLRAASWS